MPQNKIREQQARSFFEKLDSPNDEEAEDAFKKIKAFLDSNNLKFSDWIKDKGDLSDLQSKFEMASEKNRKLKGKIKILERQYSSTKAELNNI